MNAGHDGECICSTPKENHICFQICFYYNKSKNCNQYCTLPLGHINNHICSSKDAHLCGGTCYLYKRTEGKCNIDCSLLYEHKGKCICDSNQHLCNENCSLYEKAKGCNKKCKLLYKHEGVHLCDIPPKAHFCKNNCFYYSIVNKKENIEFICYNDCNLPYQHECFCMV